MGFPGCDVEPVFLSRGLVQEANPILRVLELVDPTHGLGRELDRLFPLGLSLEGRGGERDGGSGDASTHGSRYQKESDASVVVALVVAGINSCQMLL